MQRSAAQRHRVNRVVNFAQAHLAESLDLNRLAGVACLSKFHFTRVFSAYYKETPLRFLWRIRLERAARNLAFRRDKSITDVAMDCGFSSSQTLSRAFRHRFRVSPRDVKSANFGSFGGLAGPEPASGSSALSALVERWEQSPVRIESRPEIRVAYIRHIGPYWNVDRGHAKIAAVLERWARERELWGDASALIGLCPDNAALTPARNCLYDVCIAVPADVTEDEVVSIRAIPAGTFAVQRVCCTSAEMESAWDWLTTTWLASSGTPCDLLHAYEVYPLVDGKYGGPEAGVELCLRLRSD